MQRRRQNALADLKCRAEKLSKSRIVLLDGRLEEEIAKNCAWANTEGTKSCLPEIDKQIEAIKSKVCARLLLR